MKAKPPVLILAVMSPCLLWAQSSSSGTIAVQVSGFSGPPTITVTTSPLQFGTITVPPSGYVDYYPDGGTATEPYNTTLAGGNLQVTFTPARSGALTLSLTYGTPVLGFSFTPQVPRYRVNSDAYSSSSSFPNQGGGSNSGKFRG